MKLWRMGVWILATCLGVIPARSGEGWQRPYALLGPDQGLPAGGLTCLAQDGDGFLWVGTENGLFRYEGGSTTRWSRDQGLPSDYITRILAEPGGGLWVGTLRGLVRLRQGRPDPARFGGGAATRPPTAMAMDPAGHLWVTVDSELFRQEEGTLFRRVELPALGRLGVLAAGRDGAVHVGGEFGVCTLPASGPPIRFGPREGLPADGIELLIEDGGGRIWAGQGARLLVKEPGAVRFTDVSTRLKGSLSQNSHPHLDGEGAVWIPTKTGVLRLQGGRTEAFHSELGLPFRWVRTVYLDREGTLWILGASLARLQGGGRIWNHSLATSASGEVVWAIHRAGPDRLLLGTDDGLRTLGPEGLGRLPGTEGRRIKYLLWDRKGRLWMTSTTQASLWLLPGASRATPAPLGPLAKGVNTVMQDAKGRIWLAHGTQGLFQWDEDRGRLIPGWPETRPIGARQIREDAQGRLWVATNEGLAIREPEGTWHWFREAQGLPPNALCGLAFLPDGTAWLHHLEALGLMRVKVVGGRLEVLERRQKGQGIRSNMIYALEVDERGHLWAATDQGLDRVEPHLHLGLRDGMVSEDCDLYALFTEPGRVYVGTAGGLVRFDSDAPGGADALPAPHVLHVTQGSRRLLPPFSSLGPVPAAENTLSFRVAIPTYRQEGQVRVQVRMQGLEADWRTLESTAAHYPALPGGSYRFEARSLGPDGEVSPAVGVELKVLPPWWRSWWFFSLCLLVGGLGVWWAVRIRLRALARSQARLQALVAQRTEELQARHDELSEALGRVKQLSGLLPICSGCKKIRDDRGYWNQLEQYITDHSEADFSHGICPDCIRTLYPEVRVRARSGEPET